MNAFTLLHSLASGLPFWRFELLKEQKSFEKSFGENPA
jgi:hypothetical protein